MPGMDGLETAELIRSRRKSAHTPIIFITAFADEMHTARGYSLGAVDYILSPVVPNVLRSKVKALVQLHRLNAELKRRADERVALVREQAARSAAEESQRRASFLAEATQVMASSLDVDTILKGATGLVVPFLADYSAIVLIGDDGRVRGRRANAVRDRQLPPVRGNPERRPAQERIPRDALTRAAQPARAAAGGAAHVEVGRHRFPARGRLARIDGPAGRADDAARRGPARRLAHHARRDRAQARDARRLARDPQRPRVVPGTARSRTPPARGEPAKRAAPRGRRSRAVAADPREPPAQRREIHRRRRAYRGKRRERAWRRRDARAR